MKNDLLDLIKQIDDIKDHFHFIGGNGGDGNKVIYDTSEFSTWKQEVQLELQDIHDRTKDKFIWDTLVTLKQGFNGWHDLTSFNKIAGSLHAICKNIDRYYYPEKISTIKEVKTIITMPQTLPKIFISHANSDKNYVSKLVDLFEGIGLNNQHIFCSSIAGYGIPLDQDIYDYLKLQFETHNLHIIFVLSENYYDSVACMNEMGAAWILQNRYSTILLPGFEFKEIKGAINPRKIALKLDNDLVDVKEKIGQLKDCLIDEFDLPSIPDVRWEQKRDTFINYCTAKKNKIDSSPGNERNILIMPYSKAVHKVPKVNDIIPISNEILGNIKLNAIESFALLQGSKDGGGVKIKYLIKGMIEKNSSKYKEFNYVVKVGEVNPIDEIAVTSAIDNINTLFSFEEIMNL